MTMAMVINPKRPTHTIRMTTTKRTTINKTISINRVVAIIQNIHSNNNPVAATMMNRGYWCKDLVNAADVR